VLLANPLQPDLLTQRELSDFEVAAANNPISMAIAAAAAQGYRSRRAYRSRCRGAYGGHTTTSTAQTTSQMAGFGLPVTIKVTAQTTTTKPVVQLTTVQPTQPLPRKRGRPASSTNSAPHKKQPTKDDTIADLQQQLAAFQQQVQHPEPIIEDAGCLRRPRQ